MRKPKPKITLIALVLAILMTYGLYETFNKDDNRSNIENQDDNQYGDLDFKVHLEYEYNLTKVNSFRDLSALKQELITNKNERYVNILLKSDGMQHVMDAYKAADEILAILKTNQTICPIYLDIDALFSNPDIKNPYTIISYFIKRLQENKCLVGLTGSTNNLNPYLKQGMFTNIFYLSNESISDENNYLTQLNFKKIIQDNNLNNPESFLDNPVEISTSGDSLWSIMRRYYEVGNYTDYIARYNDIPDPDRIWPDMPITVPLLKRPELEETTDKFDYLSSYNKLSFLYGKSDFETFTIDFITNYSKHSSYSIKQFLENGGQLIGNAIISATTVEAAQKEANEAVTLFRENGVNSAVCIDISPSVLQELLKLHPTDIDDLLNVWYQTLHEAGYPNVLVKSSEYGIMFLSSLSLLDDKEVAIVCTPSFNMLEQPNIIYQGDNVGMVYALPLSDVSYTAEPSRIFSIRDYTIPQKNNQVLNKTNE